jgi:hypothetical protein
VSELHPPSDLAVSGSDIKIIRTNKDFIFYKNGSYFKDDLRILWNEDKALPFLISSLDGWRNAPTKSDTQLQLHNLKREKKLLASLMS